MRYNINLSLVKENCPEYNEFYKYELLKLIKSSFLNLSSDKKQ